MHKLMYSEELKVFISAWVFIYTHTLSMQTAKAESSLFADTIMI